MNVLVAMSGGVDSSVAAALLLDAGHDVVGVTMKLWGGESDTGCCSVADVDDARRVAQQLGIDHLVFNFGDDFAARMSSSPTSMPTPPAARRTPASSATATSSSTRLAERAELLGFDAVATGHHARVVPAPDRGPWRLARGRRPGQGPVLRAAHARAGGARPHAVPGRRPDQGRGPPAAPPRSACAPRPSPTARTCASSPRPEGRRASCGDADAAARRAAVVDTAGRRLGAVDGRRAGDGRPAQGRRAAGRRAGRATSSTSTCADAVVTVGSAAELLVDDAARRGVHLGRRARRRRRPRAVPAPTACPARRRSSPGADGAVVVRWHQPQRRVAPGQSVVLVRRHRRVRARRRRRVGLSAGVQRVRVRQPWCVAALGLGHGVVQERRAAEQGVRADGGGLARTAALAHDGLRAAQGHLDRGAERPAGQIEGFGGRPGPA